jgi:hypothetical protein
VTTSRGVRSVERSQMIRVCHETERRKEIRFALTCEDVSV